VPRLNPLREKSITQDTRYNREAIKKSTMEEATVPSIDTTDIKVSNEDDLEECIFKQRDDFECAINTPGIGMKEIDVISKNEIGKPKIKLDKPNLVNSLIMLEVLGKPKALKKYKS